MPKANTADFGRFVLAIILACIRTRHKDYGQSVVNNLTPRALVLQTHPFPVFIRKKQQWRRGEKQQGEGETEVSLLNSQKEAKNLCSSLCLS